MGVGQKRKTVKNGENPPFFVLFVWIMYSFVLCGAFFGVCAWNWWQRQVFRNCAVSVIGRDLWFIIQGARKMHRLWRAARTPPFFYAHEPQRIAGKNLAASTQGNDYKKAHNVYYV